MVPLPSLARPTSPEARPSLRQAEAAPWRSGRWLGAELQPPVAGEQDHCQRHDRGLAHLLGLGRLTQQSVGLVRDLRLVWVACH